MLLFFILSILSILFESASHKLKIARSFSAGKPPVKDKKSPARDDLYEWEKIFGRLLRDYTCLSLAIPSTEVPGYSHFTCDETFQNGLAQALCLLLLA